jgi:hypothetical protein
MKRNETKRNGKNSETKRNKTKKKHQGPRNETKWNEKKSLILLYLDICVQWLLVRKNMPTVDQLNGWVIAWLNLQQIAKDRSRLHRTNHRILITKVRRIWLQKIQTKLVYQSIDSERFKPRAIASWLKHFGIQIAVAVHSTDSGGKHFAHHSSNPSECGSFWLWSSYFLHFAP